MSTLPQQITAYAKDDVLERFLRYVTFDTTSDWSSETNPSTPGQRILAEQLAREARALGYKDVHVDAHAFVYVQVPASPGITTEPIGLLAHIDTSPDQSGKGVQPQVHRNWEGGTIRFPDDPELTLSSKDSAHLEHFIGDTIITASGKTLLGADDKSGVATLMTALACWQRFPELKHGPVTVCFTHDEEIARGVVGIDLKRLPKFGYTLDGGEPGEVEGECFDAWSAKVEIQGVGVHPGYAKDKMINAALIVADIISNLPPNEIPARTSGREGFFHVTEISGGNENASLEMIIRDFDPAKNALRMELLSKIIAQMNEKYRGAVVKVTYVHQYENMKKFLAPYPFVLERARQAVRRTGIPVKEQLIRGGTDGARLSAQGHPTPNIFSCQFMIHSRKEWTALSGLANAVETVLHLAEEWAVEGK